MAREPRSPQISPDEGEEEGTQNPDTLPPRIIQRRKLADEESNALMEDFAVKPHDGDEKVAKKAAMKKNVKQYFKGLFPPIEWVPDYKNDWKKKIVGDISAGITVGVMLIPQGMAYAILAGVAPVYGLYCAFVPLIVYGFLGTGRQLAVGPVAMVSLLTATAVNDALNAEIGDFYGENTDAAAANDASNTTVTELFPPDHPQRIENVILLAFLVGIFELILGFARAGFVVNFLSHPVLSAFTSAAAIIIGVSQIKFVLGVSVPRMHYFVETVIETAKAIPRTNLWSLLIGGVAIVILYVWQRLSRKFPKMKFVPIQLILVAISTGLTFAFKWDSPDSADINVVGAIPQGLPNFTVPNFDIGRVQFLLPNAIIITLVGFMESVSVAKKFAVKNGYEIQPNQELVAMGAANFLGSFFLAFPVAGGFGRSAVQDQAGAKTMLSSALASIVVILTLLFLTPVFYTLPNAVLGAIVIVAVSSLFDLTEIRHLWKVSKPDFIVWWITFLVTLGLGIELGIGVSLGVSIIFVLGRASRPSVVRIARKEPGSEVFRNAIRYPNAVLRKEVVMIRIDAPLFFANVNFVRDHVEDLILTHYEEMRKRERMAATAAGDDTQGHEDFETMEKSIENTRRVPPYTVLEMSSVTSIDSVGLTFLESLEKWCSQQGNATPTVVDKNRKRKAEENKKPNITRENTDNDGPNATEASDGEHEMHNVVSSGRQEQAEDAAENIEGTRLLFCSVRGPARDQLIKAGLVKKWGQNRFFFSPPTAEEWALRHAPADVRTESAV